MRTLHWATAAGVLGCFGFVQLAQRTKDKKQKGKYMRLHKSSGLLVAACVTPRVAVRLASKIPAQLPGAAWEHFAASASHTALYGMRLFMPASGIAMGYYGGQGLPFFSYTIPGRPSPSKEDKKFAGLSYRWHKRVGLAFEYLVPLHMAASGYHVMKGQAIFRRINPFA